MIGLNPTIIWLIHVKSHYLTPLMSTGGCHPHDFLDIAEASSTGNMAWHTAQVGRFRQRNGDLSTKKLRLKRQTAGFFIHK